MPPPRHVQAFGDALLALQPAPIPIPGTEPLLVGRPGIREWVRIKPNREKYQLLGRKHEYTFMLPDGRVLEFSAQLDRGNYWRLYGYCAINGRFKGMLFSVNPELGHDGSNVVRLQQKLKLSTRGVSSEDRSEMTEALAARLMGLGFNVTDERDLELGSFDARRGKFIGTTAAGFIRDFVAVAVLKGHYMANKNYSLPDLEAGVRPEPIRIRSKRTPVEVTEVLGASRERQGEFDPQSAADARQRIFGAIVQRRGQPAFRRELLAAYGGKCAVTRCDCKEALEAAHITPYLGDHTNVITNGLLLRSDIHTLFDLGLIAIDSVSKTLLIAPSLAGSAYGKLAGRRILLPKSRAEHPSESALAQHRKSTGL